jgi:hypothetical protein
MTYTGTKARRKSGSYWLALVILAIAGFAAYWAVTTLFPVELQQTAHWFQMKFEALRK